MPHLVYPFSSQWTFGLLPIWGCNATVNICACIPFCGLVSKLHMVPVLCLLIEQPEPTDWRGGDLASHFPDVEEHVKWEILWKIQSPTDRMLGEVRLDQRPECWGGIHCRGGGDDLSRHREHQGQTPEAGTSPVLPSNSSVGRLMWLEPQTEAGIRSLVAGDYSWLNPCCIGAIHVWKVWCTSGMTFCDRVLDVP